MKKRNLFLSIASVTVILLSSCSKPEVTVKPTSSTTTVVIPTIEKEAKMSAFIDGELYSNLTTKNFPDANATSLVTINNSRFVMVQGFDEEVKQEITLYIPENKLLVGTYTMDNYDGNSNGENFLCSYKNYANPNATINVKSGEIKIEEIDIKTNQIKGTFSFDYTEKINDVIVDKKATNGSYKYSLDAIK
jgi:hypothetical protein